VNKRGINVVVDRIIKYHEGEDGRAVLITQVKARTKTFCAYIRYIIYDMWMDKVLKYKPAGNNAEPPWVVNRVLQGLVQKLGIEEE
jgi:hypothetical protein